MIQTIALLLVTFSNAELVLNLDSSRGVELKKGNIASWTDGKQTVYPDVASDFYDSFEIEHVNGAIDFGDQKAEGSAIGGMKRFVLSDELSSSIFDFSRSNRKGGAGDNSGFTLFVVLKDNSALEPEQVPVDILGAHTSVSKGFHLRYLSPLKQTDGTGILSFSLSNDDSNVMAKDAVSRGDRIKVGLRYDAKAGTTLFSYETDTKSESISGRAARNENFNFDGLAIGGTDAASRAFMGHLYSLQIYNEKLSDDAFHQKFQELLDR